MASGSSQIRAPGGVMRITYVLDDYFAPDNGDSLYQEVGRFLQSDRTTRFLDEYLVRIELLRWMAGPRMQMGGAFLETLVSISRVQSASSPRTDKSPALTSAQGQLGTVFARLMGRLIGPRGGLARRVLLVATDVEVHSSDDDDA